MPLNSTKRPPYWNSTSGFNFYTSHQSTCHSIPVCEILSKSDHPWRTLCKHVTIGHFCCFDCLLTVFDDWYTVGTDSVPIVTGLPRLYQQCTNRQKQSKTVKRQSKQQKWTLVYQSSHVYQECTNSVPTVYLASKTVKRQSKQQKGELVYQSSQVYQDCTNCVPTVY